MKKFECKRLERSIVYNDLDNSIADAEKLEELHSIAKKFEKLYSILFAWHPDKINKDFRKLCSNCVANSSDLNKSKDLNHPSDLHCSIDSSLNNPTYSCTKIVFEALQQRQ